MELRGPYDWRHSDRQGQAVNIDPDTRREKRAAESDGDFVGLVSRERASESELIRLDRSTPHGLFIISTSN